MYLAGMYVHSYSRITIGSCLATYVAIELVATYIRTFILHFRQDDQL